MTEAERAKEILSGHADWLFEPSGLRTFQRIEEELKKQGIQVADIQGSDDGTIKVRLPSGTRITRLGIAYSGDSAK